MSDKIEAALAKIEAAVDALRDVAGESCPVYVDGADCGIATLRAEFADLRARLDSSIDVSVELAYEGWGGGAMTTERQAGERFQTSDESWSNWKRSNLDLALDPGIEEFVRILRDNGVETFESCDGSPGHAFPDPTIRFHGHAAAGYHALGVALDFGLPVVSLRREWSIQDAELTGPNWEMVFRRIAALKTLGDAAAVAGRGSPVRADVMAIATLRAEMARGRQRGAREGIDVSEYRETPLAGEPDLFRKMQRRVANNYRRRDQFGAVNLDARGIYSVGGTCHTHCRIVKINHDDTVDVCSVGGVTRLVHNVPISELLRREGGAT